MSETTRAATPAVATVREKTSLLRHYLWKYRKMVFLGLCTLLLVDLLELAAPVILKKAVDGVVEQKPYEDLIQFAAMYLGVLMLQGVGRWGWRIFLVRSSMMAGRDLREKLGGHLFGLPATYYDKNRVGDLMSHANGDVEAVRQFLGPGFLTFADALFYVLTVPIAMYMLSPKLTLLALLPLPLIPFFVLKFQNQIHARFKASQNHFSKISAMAQENLNGIRVTKAFAIEDVQLGRFKALGREYIRLNLNLARIQSSFGPLMDFVASLGIVLLIWFGGGWVIDDAISLGTFVAFQRYIQKMVWPMMAVGFSVSFYQRALASSDRLKAILATESNIVETTDPKTPMAAGQVRTPGKIEIRNLTFSFPESDAKEPVLKNVSLTIESGQRVAFVGGIGSGKSALLSLLPRLYPAPKGTIFVDGVAIEDWELSRLRGQIGYVSQEVFLFSENVFENVAFGLNDEKYGVVKSRVMSSVELATVKSDIENLPKGFDTQLGERGVNLSGGQKQRVTLARAVAKEPSILILDDALSAVDVKTENSILSSLRSRPGKNTEIIAAHRISTIRDADRIFVLHQGEIVDQGTHRELVAKKSGIYHQFYEQQRLKEDLERYMERVDEKLDEAGVVPS